jgi:multicomponent Na+:H+ antiporter subunit C
MTQFLVYALASAALFAICVHGLIARAHLVRKVLAVNMMGSAVFLLFVAIAFRNRGDFPDPVPHAMVLTGIVVAVSATALALALVRRIHAATGQSSLDEGDGDR